MLRLSAVAISFLLVGCATVLPTLERPNSPSASIRFAVVTGNNAVIQKVSGPECDSKQEELLADLGVQLAIDRGHGRRTGMPLPESFNPKLMTEVKVEANRPYSFEIRGLLPSSIPTSSPHCRQIVTFTPESEANYELLFSLTPPTCAVKVMRLIIDSSGTYVRSPSVAARTTDSCKQRFLW